jgi:hypothetical protein
MVGIYFEEERMRQRTTKRVFHDETRKIPVHIGKLRELLSSGRSHLTCF